MPTIKVALCTVQLELPEAITLKDKRSILKSMLQRLHNQFNVATAEIDYHDNPQASVIAFTTVTTATNHAHSMVSNVLNWIEKQYPEAQITDQAIEIL